MENQEIKNQSVDLMTNRFRGYMPVAVDVETAGFNASTDALLEIAAVSFVIDEKQQWQIGEIINRHIQPFEGANLDEESLNFTGIDPEHPFRKQIAMHEKDALQEVFKFIRNIMKIHDCKRAILLGHNPSFDLGFINAAVERNKLKRNPFHPFSTLDTATLGGLAYGQTVLSRAVIAAGLEWDSDQAHSARYDAERTAELFCNIINRWGQID